MIPDEAVEAAAKGVSPYVWDEFRIGFVAHGESAERARERAKDEVRKLARAALEAAIPHLMAPALALADQWQEDFPYKANQLREALGGAE